nr:CAP domain-containing protein [uncultured Bacillus sp.]
MHYHTEKKNEQGGESLKTFIRIIISLLVLVVIGFWLNISDKENKEDSPNTIQSGDSSKQSPVLSEKDIRRDSLLKMVGKSIGEVQNLFGEPTRIDLSSYGYDWWIYDENPEEYLQIGIDDDRVVTIYAIGKKAEISPFYIGQSIGDIYAQNIVDTSIRFKYKGSSYRFELSEEDMNTNPLIQIDNVFVQLYMDKFSGELSSIRLMDAPTLIKIRPYELLFRGNLLEPPNEIELDEKQLERDLETELYNLVNIIRSQSQLPSFQWDEKTADASYKHSVDMYDNNNFSHELNGVLSDRLTAAGVVFQSAGENIAYNNIDAPDVIEEWLNSKKYRENLLNTDFTHAGTGVYKNYYTQVFTQK